MKRNLAIAIVLIAMPLAAKTAVSTDLPGVVVGTITAVQGQNITVAGISIDAGGAKIHTSRGVENLSSLAAGMHIIATLEPNSLRASAIQADPDVRLTGHIEAIEPGAVRVLGRSIAVTPKTLYGGFGADKAIHALDDLAAPLSITVDAESSGGNLVALRIFGNGVVPPPPAAKPIPAKAELTDVVKSIDGKVWIVGTTRVLVSPQTKITGAPQTGDSVKVTGIKAPDKNVLAVTIEKQ